MLNTAFIRKRFKGLAVLATGVIVFSGCDRDSDVKVYRLAKDAPATAAPANMPAAAENGGAALSWTLPAGWEEQAPSQMRVASFLIKGQDKKQADVSVIPLPGGAGGDFANVNRWRGQVGLQPVAENDLKKFAEPVSVGDGTADLYDVAGKNPGTTEPTRILAAIHHRGGEAWFFKMTGDDQLVGLQKPKFVEFLKSIKFPAPSMAGLPPSHPPIDSVSAAPTPMGSANSSEGKPEWQPPAGWREVPGGQFLVAKFMIGGDGAGQASMNVSASAGDGGGVAANVNRWRKQLGLADVAEAEAACAASPFETTGGKALMVDLSGTDARSGQPARMIGVIVPQSDRTWFYKLMGDAKVVEAQKDVFTAFVKGVKY